MNFDVDVKPTVECINGIARYLRETADRIDKIAEKMYKTKDITYASEVMYEITGIFLNARLDLLITRPIREFQHLIQNREF
jgi:hypothetical protein